MVRVDKRNSGKVNGKAKQANGQAKPGGIPGKAAVEKPKEVPNVVYLTPAPRNLQADPFAGEVAQIEKRLRERKNVRRAELGVLQEEADTDELRPTLLAFLDQALENLAYLYRNMGVTAQALSPEIVPLVHKDSPLPDPSTILATAGTLFALSIRIADLNAAVSMELGDAIALDGPHSRRVRTAHPDVYTVEAGQQREADSGPRPITPKAPPASIPNSLVELVNTMQSAVLGFHQLDWDDITDHGSFETRDVCDILTDLNNLYEELAEAAVKSAVYGSSPKCIALIERTAGEGVRP